MAYTPKQLRVDNGPFPKQLRAIAYTVQPKTFATGSVTLPALTPVAYNTSSGKWVVWTNSGSNGTGTISGFVWPDAVVLSSSGDVLGNVMLEGKINFNDIALPSGQNLSDLKTACQSGPRALGLIIEGLPNVR